ncbi:Proteophosphoglycan ppg4 [Rhodotorula toruloides]
MTQRRDSSPRSRTERSEHDSCLCWPWDGNLTVVGLFRDMLLFDTALSLGLEFFTIDGLPLTTCDGESLPWRCIARTLQTFTQEFFVQPYQAMPSVEGYTVVTSEAFGSWLLGILMLSVVVCGITFGNLFLLIIVGFPGKPTWHGVLRDALIVWARVAFTIEVGRLSYRTATSAFVKSPAVHTYEFLIAIVHYFFAPESSEAGKAIITTHTVVVWFVGVGVLSFVGTYGFARHPLPRRAIAANVLLVVTAPLLVRSILQRLPFAFDAFTTVVFHVALTVALLVYAIDKQEIPLEQDATIEPTDMAEKGEKDQLGLLVDVA